MPQCDLVVVLQEKDAQRALNLDLEELLTREDQGLIIPAITTRAEMAEEAIHQVDVRVRRVEAVAALKRMAVSLKLRHIILLHE